MGETMAGLPRLDNVQDLALDVIRSNVPGDFIETGVWRGGITILMKGILDVFCEWDRAVWVADSFVGLPKPDAEQYPADAGDTFWTQDWMAVSQEEVAGHFAQYGLLDERVKFLKGWFKDTLPVAPIERLALLRIDGDMYESTMDALRPLYPKLSPGGYVIVDDYGAVPGCKAAVDDYRREHNIHAGMTFVEDNQMSCIFWQKG
jgi:O-methyltransferase